MEPRNVLSTSSFRKEPRALMTASTGLTPDIIASKLFSYHSWAHLYHLQTTSFAQHKMLEGLYEALEDSKDSICEYLLGVQIPMRFGNIVMEQPEPFSDQVLVKFLDDGFNFSVSLISYGNSCNFEQLSNLASELQGTFIRAKYLNSLK